MYNSYKKKKYFFLSVIIIFFLTIPFSLFAEDQNQDPQIYNFPDFQATIHAKTNGGYWNNTNTWEENRIPTEDDYVELHGNVILQGANNEGLSYRIKGIYLKENTSLHSNYGVAHVYAEELFLSENNTQTQTNVYTQGDIINYGSINSLHLENRAHLENYGNIESISISNGNFSIDSQGGHINKVVFLDATHAVFSKSLHNIGTLKTNGNSEISFEDEQDNDIFVRKIEGSYDIQKTNIIHGNIYLSEQNDALKLSHIQANSITLQNGANFKVACKNQIINADILLEENSHIYPPTQYSCGSLREGDFYPRVLKNIFVSQGASIDFKHSNIFSLEGDITNYGEVYNGIFHGSVENHGNFYHYDYRGVSIKAISLGGSEKIRSLSGLEDYELWIKKGEVILSHPLRIKKLVGTGRNGIIPTLSFDIQNHAHVYIAESIHGFDNVNGNPYLDIQGTVHFVENNPHSIRGTIKANLVIVEDGTGLSVNKLIAPLVIKKTDRISGNTCNTFHSCGYFYGDIIIGNNIESFFKTDSSAYYAYFYKNLDFQGDASAFGRNTNISLANENLNDGPYQFEIELADGRIMQETENTNFYIYALHNYREDKPYIKIRELVENHTQFRWRSKSANSDWSEWHTVNKKLYLEAKPSFFSLQGLENITENEAKEITIITEESDFSGELQLHINQGNISPETITMENGRAEVSVIFDTPQEDAILSVTSREHPLLSGTSEAFTIEHQIQTDFFSVPALTDIHVGEELHIELIPKEENYTGDISIYLQAEDGTRKRLYAVGRDQSGMYTFPYQAQDEDLGKSYQFFFQDETQPYLQGMSLPFSILPRKQHHGGGSRIIRQSFFNQGANTRETEEESYEEAEGSPTDNPEGDVSEAENGKQTEEQNDERVEEPNFILENQCLDIHSIYPSLSKSRRRLLKSTPEERENVKHLQEKLKSLNFLEGNIDGDFGPMTQKALQDFQEQHGLSPDGIFGRNTSHYVDTHCSNLQEKKETNEETTTKETENQGNENTENNNESTDEENSWFEDIWDGIKNWIGNLFGIHTGDESQDQVIEGELQQTYTIIHDSAGKPILQVNDLTKLRELVDKYNLKMPAKDKMVIVNGEETPVQEEIPEEVLQGKILYDVPYIPQRIKVNGENNPPGGGSMCSGASVAMIADYYNKLPNRNPKIQKIQGIDVDMDLREYVWEDKGQNLQSSCYKKGALVTGTYAYTSEEKCGDGFLHRYKSYFQDKVGLRYGVLKDYNGNIKFSNIKNAINNNHPVIFGEPGHIMVAVGYLDFKDKDKTNIIVNLERDGVITKRNVSVIKDFLLIVNDPKRNRNRSKEHGGYFASDGKHSAYLIVSIKSKNKKIEYMCRSGKGSLDREYYCTPTGNTALEIY